MAYSWLLCVKGTWSWLAPNTFRRAAYSIATQLQIGIMDARKNTGGGRVCSDLSVSYRLILIMVLKRPGWVH